MSDLWLPQSVSNIQMQGDVGSVQFGSDERLIVWFFRKSVLHGIKSREAGRPIYEGHDFIHIQQPGERDTIEREATDLDKRRWAKRWDAYQAQREQEAEGTPLATLFPNEPEIVDMLRGLKIQTTEQLEHLSEHAIGQVGAGARMWIEKAKKFNEAARGLAPVHALERELEAEREKSRQLSESLAAVERRLAALESHDEPRRGRKQEHQA